MNTDTWRGHLAVRARGFSDGSGVDLYRAEHIRGEIVYHPYLMAPNGEAWYVPLRVHIPWESRGRSSRWRGVYELIAASMPFLRNNLVYHPRLGRPCAKYEREKASYDASSGYRCTSIGIWPTGLVFHSMNAAVGYGFLRVLDGGERPTFRDVAILRRLPNELSAVAGVITLEPQTPAVAREPARRAGRGAERLHRHRAGRSRDRRAHRQVRALRGDGESRAPRTRSPRRPRSRWRRTTKAVARLRRRPRSGTCR